MKEQEKKETSKKEETNNIGKKDSIFRIHFIDFIIEKIRNDELGEIIHDWRWIFSYSKKYKWQIVVFTLFGIFSTTFGLVSSVANKYMVDIVTGHKTEMLWLMITIWLGTNILSLVMSSVNSRYSAKVTTAISRDVQEDVFRKVIDADWMALQQYPNGDILNRINGDAGTISSNAISWVPNLIIVGYNFIATFLVIWHYSKGMTLIAVAGAPILFLARRAFLIKEREYHKKSRELSSKIFTYETESLHRMDTVKSMGLVDRFTDGFEDTQGEMRDFALERNAFDIKRNIVMRLLQMALTAVSFAYALWLLWGNQITYGTMMLFVQQRGRLTSAMMNVGSIIPTFVNSSVSAHRVVELMELPPERHVDDDEEIPIPDKVTLIVSDMEFTYDDGEPVIRDGGLTVSTGEMIALVGPTGRGKTTLLRIMLGLIYPDSGVCAIKDGDGVSIEVNADTRHLFSYVPQGNSLFAGTIAENLRMMNEDASDDELVEALKMADAWEFVEKLPEGIESKVRENGRGLSEGQAQRIAIARALLRESPILLFDEATSALDVATERRVLDNLKTQTKGRALVITTHRPSVMEMCDRVYQVDDGYLRDDDTEK